MEIPGVVVVATYLLYAPYYDYYVVVVGWMKGLPPYPPTQSILQILDPILLLLPLPSLRKSEL